MKRNAAVILSVVLGIGGLAAWELGRFSGASAEIEKSTSDVTAIPVTAAVAKRQDVPAYIRALGTVQSIDAVSVQPRVSGQIVQIDFKPGDEVKKGQSLFLIDPRPYQAALDQAQAQLARDKAALEEAKVDLARYQRLAKTNAIPEQQAQDQAFVVKQAEGTVQLDQANVESARLNLDYCRIVSPISGRAGALLVDLGNVVQATTPTNLVSITQVRPIDVTFTIPQSALGEVREHQNKGELDVEARSQSGKTIGSGKLILIDNQVDQSTGTVKLQATFPNQDEALWPGEFVNVRLIVFIRRDAISVPARTVMEGPSGSYVYLIRADDTVRRVAVHVAARQDDIAVIDRGLAGGQRVVTDGQNRLDNGVKVQVPPSRSSG